MALRKKTGNKIIDENQDPNLSKLLKSPEQVIQEKAQAQEMQQKPQEKTKRKIIFNRDGNIEVTEGDITQQLSKEDYKKYQENIKVSKGTPSKAGSGLSGQQKVDALISASQKPSVSPETQQAVQNIGQLPFDMTLPQKDIGEEALSYTAAGLKAAGSIAGGAAAGAAAGSVVPVIGTAIGGVIGGVGGAIGALHVFSSKEKKDITKAYKNYTLAKSNINNIIRNVNSGAITPEQAVEIYNEQIEVITLAEAKLKEETSNSLEKFLAGGDEELMEIENFKRNRWLYDQKLSRAMLKPNPLASEIESLQPNI